MFQPVRGLVAAPFLPCDDAGEPDLGRIPAYAASLRRSGVGGVFVNGTTGEGTSLTSEQREAVTEAWLATAGDLRVIVHAGHLSIAESSRLAAHAQAKGAAGVGVLPNVYHRPATAAEAVAGLRPVAAAAPELPLYYYHIPHLTQVRLQMLDLVTLARREIPNFAGVKFTFENLFDFARCVDQGDPNVSMLFGRDEIFLAGLVHGAQGFVGSSYSLMAPLYVRLWDAFRAGDLPAARQLQGRVRRHFGPMLADLPGLPAMKAAMGLIGLPMGPVRAPMPNLNPEQTQTLRLRLEATGFFEDANQL